MSSISSISSLNNLSYSQPTTNAPQSVGGNDSDNESKNGSNASKTGGVGRSNFLSAIEQALGQSLGISSATPTASTTNTTQSNSSTQNSQVALQSFLHNLFTALQQSGGQGNSATTTGSSTATPGVEEHQGGSRGSNLVAGIQNLLQQLSATNQSAPTTGQSNATSGQSSSSNSNALSNLSASFQNLISAINTSQGQGASTSNATPTLQSFLQNLQLDLKSGKHISGAVVNTVA